MYVAKIVKGKVKEVVPVTRFRLDDGSTPTIEYLIPLGYAEIDYDYYKPTDTEGKWFYPLPPEEWEIVEEEVAVKIWNKAKRLFEEKTGIYPAKVRVTYAIEDLPLEREKQAILNEIGGIPGESFNLLLLCLLLLHSIKSGKTVADLDNVLNSMINRLSKFVVVKKAVESATTREQLQFVKNLDAYKDLFSSKVDLDVTSLIEKLVGGQ